MKRFSGRIYGVHYKDFVFARDGMWEDVVVGTGNLDVAAFVTALNEDGFDGFAVIEYEANAADPGTAEGNIWVLVFISHARFKIT